MSTVGLVCGILLGAVIGALVGRYYIYTSLNKTNLIGDDEFGKKDINASKSTVATNIFPAIVGVIFTGLGAFITWLSFPKGQEFAVENAISVHSSNAGLMVFGIIMCGFGALVAIVSIVNIFKKK